MFGCSRRGGTRGGQAEFSWGQVKSDAQREKYLGHSLHAAVGRWQKGRDIQWYNREKQNGGEDDTAAKAQERRREELREIKAREEEEIRKRLGSGPLPPSMTGESISAPNLGRALACGSSRTSSHAYASMGADSSSFDFSRLEQWGSNSKGVARGKLNDSGSSSEIGRDSGLRKEERKSARRIAKKEAKRNRHEERERIREERRQRRTCHDERESNRHKYRDCRSSYDRYQYEFPSGCKRDEDSTDRRYPQRSPPGRNQQLDHSHPYRHNRDVDNVRSRLKDTNGEGHRHRCCSRSRSPDHAARRKRASDW